MNPKIELPPKYYLEHFLELRATLKERYGPFFAKEHHDFFQCFDSLTEDAQCLYLRLVNRKGKIFLRSTLVYKEINNFEDSLRLLFETGFARDVVESDWNEVVTFLPKAKLFDILRDRGVDVRKSWPREKLEEELKRQPFGPLPELLVQGKTEELTFLLFLFFGKIQENLSLYTLRDLGVRKVNKEKAKFRARFETPEDAQTHYFFSKYSSRIDELPPISEWPMPVGPECLALKEEVLLTLAEKHRKNQDYDDAISVLALATIHPAREKRARLLYQLDRKEECLSVLNSIIEAPTTDEELLFAEDFLARKFQKKKLSVLTETLRNARKVSIDESYFRQPEMGVQAYLKDQGSESHFLENYVFCALFGLLFWEELFESDKTALFNEFERLPKDLRGPKFYEVHETQIQEKLRRLCCDYILTKCREKFSIPNGIFGWHDNLPEYLEFVLEHSELDGIRKILLHMAKDYYNRSTGFPDLVAKEAGRLKFYEIKAEGDVLKERQLLQIKALKEAGFEVEILQVRYAFNPNQLYVVVDIETTGGSMPYHRITELGAVKVRNGEVIEKFQTLVNPERWISREIQALTGITNEMVKTAPRFAEVLEEFDEFTKDAIFVAHNVGFDYGFIQGEFEKCEKRFVRPHICTKVGMKKHYPGLESYSLKNLTSHFNISLTQHHRALCDAEAAAQLLFLINKKRALDSKLELEPVDPGV